MRGSAVRGAVLGVLAASPMLLWLRGFMVDDALITARYAANVAAGLGHRFNAGDAAATDGVTPLGFAWLLAPFARGAEPVLAAFAAAQWLGALAWLAGAALVGVAIDRAVVDDAPLRATTVDDAPRNATTRAAPRRRFCGLLVIAASAPLGAWAGSGMETGVVLGLAAAAAAARALGRERACLACAAVAAAWRPELVPWAFALAVTRARGAPHDKPTLLLRVAGTMAPPAAVVVARLVWFGRALPLAFYAKAPSLTLGVRYAAACFLLTGVVAALGWRGLPPWTKGLIAAMLVHFGAIALAGGDWMPLSRLAVPVLPSAAIAASVVLARAGVVPSVVRLGLAAVGELFVAVTVGPSARAVSGERLRVVRELAPALASATSVATVDSGWVGAATQARVVDLAGVTDPAIAAHPGGHTSKRIPSHLFEARGVDALVLLLAPGAELASPWSETRFARAAEAHVAMLPQLATRFCPVAVSTGKLRYAVVTPCAPGR